MSTEPSATHTTNSYVLGHADVEIRRLLLQARLYDNDTEHALHLAGLGTGMRVLDVGCGPGDVSFVAARLVGPAGTVLGVDAAAEIIEVARTRAAEQGLSWVSFEQATITDITLDEPVDAVVGRLILMHLPDPVSALRHLAALVRPGGVIAFCESDIGAVRSFPETPQFRAVTQGIVSAFRAVGLDPGFGTTLHSLFQRAGLPPPQLTLAAPIGGVNDPDIFAYAMEVWRLMLPIAEKLGLVTDDLADIDSLLSRWRQEAATEGAVIMMPPMITAWTRLPGLADPPVQPVGTHELPEREHPLPHLAHDGLRRQLPISGPGVALPVHLEDVPEQLIERPG